MKYLWIVILAVMYLLWALDSVKDVIFCLREYKNLDDIEESTVGWFVTSVGIVFAYSLFKFILES